MQNDDGPRKARGRHAWRDDYGRLGIAEGIETALSAAQIFKTPVWAAFSANGIAGLPIIAGVKSLRIFADQTRREYRRLESVDVDTKRRASKWKFDTRRHPATIGMTTQEGSKLWQL